MNHPLNEKEEKEWQDYLAAKRAKSQSHGVFWGLLVLAVFLIVMLLSVCSGGFRPGMFDIGPR